MSAARDKILGRIRAKLGKENRDASEKAVRKRFSSLGVRKGENPIPSRAQINAPDQLQLFCDMAETANATVTVVNRLEEVPACVANYLADHNLPAEVVRSPDKCLDKIPWENQPMLSLRIGRAEDADSVSITPVWSAVAETGTLVLASGAETPVTLNFMPDTHIAIVRGDQIVGTYEEAWEDLRKRKRQMGDSNFMPRTVNWVTGPSRSADVAKTMFLGAHGPRRLHIVVVDSGEGV